MAITLFCPFSAAYRPICAVGVGDGLPCGWRGWTAEAFGEVGGGWVAGGGVRPCGYGTVPGTSATLQPPFCHPCPHSADLVVCQADCLGLLLNHEDASGSVLMLVRLGELEWREVEGGRTAGAISEWYQERVCISGFECGRCGGSQVSSPGLSVGFRAALVL